MAQTVDTTLFNLRSILLDNQAPKFPIYKIPPQMSLHWISQFKIAVLLKGKHDQIVGCRPPENSVKHNKLAVPGKLK